MKSAGASDTTIYHRNDPNCFVTRAPLDFHLLPMLLLDSVSPPSAITPCWSLFTTMVDSSYKYDKACKQVSSVPSVVSRLTRILAQTQAGFTSIALALITPPAIQVRSQRTTRADPANRRCTTLSASRMKGFSLDVARITTG